MKISLDLSATGLKFTRPDILQHPNIPKYLSGVNPRTLMGKEWWDRHRKQVYEVNNYHCFACGVSSSNAKYHQWLEAHECYDYLWDKLVLRYRETVALCYTCHNFIHSGRLYNLYLDRKVAKDKIQFILMHGLVLLYGQGLKPDQKVIYIASRLGGQAQKYITKNKIKANTPSVLHAVDLLEPGWRMQFEGRLYNTLGMEVTEDEGQSSGST